MQFNIEHIFSFLRVKDKLNFGKGVIYRLFMYIENDQKYSRFDYAPKSTCKFFNCTDFGKKIIKLVANKSLVIGQES